MIWVLSKLKYKQKRYTDKNNQFFYWFWCINHSISYWISIFSNYCFFSVFFTEYSIINNKKSAKMYFFRFIYENFSICQLLHYPTNNQKVFVLRESFKIGLCEQFHVPISLKIKSLQDVSLVWVIDNIE
jgi:hypothetical protein